MAQPDHNRHEIERRLKRYRELMAEYKDGPTAENLRELEVELLASLQSDAPSAHRAAYYSGA
jgi:hypothetical protein